MRAERIRDKQFLPLEGMIVREEKDRYRRLTKPFLLKSVAKLKVQFCK